MGIPMGGSGGASAKFEKIGDKIVDAKVLSAELIPLLNYDTGLPEIWPNGKPKDQMRTVLATSFRNHELLDPDKVGAADDGERVVYVKGHLWTATVQALQAANSSEFEPGATVSILFHAEGEEKKRGYRRPKLFKVKYTPPVATGAAFSEDDFG